MNVDNTYEQEIDLKDLLFAVLYRWRLILVIAVLFAVLLGGYRLVTTYRAQTNPQVLAEAQEEYQKALEIYENDAAIIDRDMQTLMSDVEEQMDYMDHSVLMNMNPYNVWEAKTAFFVRPEIENAPDMMYQSFGYADTILQTYALSLSGSDFRQEVADQAGIELPYLNELIAITSENNLLTLQVRYEDEEGARVIMDYLVDGVKQFRHEIADSVGDHVITKVSSSIDSVVDLDLIEAQEGQQQRLTLLNNNLKQKQTALDGLTEPEDMSAPAASALKNGVKYGVLGGVLGAFMVVFFVCVVFLMSDKLYSAKQLKNCCGVKILGILPLPSGRKGAVDRWLNRLEGRAVPGAEENEYALAAVNILNYAGDVKMLLVAGTAESEKVSGVAEQLSSRLPGILVVPAGNMLQDSETLKKLPECDGVVLVEQCRRSAYGQVKAEVEKATDLRKPVIGCVVFE